MHHTMEERHVFPILAKGIPKFASSTHGGHVDSHREIHDGVFLDLTLILLIRISLIPKGLENLTQNVAKWKENPTSYSPTEMRASLDALSDVLFPHLDQEVYNSSHSIDISYE